MKIHICSYVMLFLLVISPLFSHISPTSPLPSRDPAIPHLEWRLRRQIRDLHGCTSAVCVCVHMCMYDHVCLLNVCSCQLTFVSSLLQQWIQRTCPQCFSLSVPMGPHDFQPPAAGAMKAATVAVTGTYPSQGYDHWEIESGPLGRS